jgi:hypothetical protein
MDVMLGGCRSKGGSLEAAVAEQISLEAERGQPRQYRQCAGAVIRIGWPQFEIEQRTCLSQTTKSFTPLTNLPPSVPRTQAVGADRKERLSATTTEGRTSSLQARRQSSARRWPNRRQSPMRVQRAKLLCRVVKGMPESQPVMRHCMPPKVSIQISPIVAAGVKLTQVPFEI